MMFTVVKTSSLNWRLWYIYDNSTGDIFNIFYSIQHSAQWPEDLQTVQLGTYLFIENARHGTLSKYFCQFADKKLLNFIYPIVCD